MAKSPGGTAVSHSGTGSDTGVLYLAILRTYLPTYLPSGMVHTKLPHDPMDASAGGSFVTSKSDVPPLASSP